MRLKEQEQKSQGKIEKLRAEAIERFLILLIKYWTILNGQLKLISLVCTVTLMAMQKLKMKIIYAQCVTGLN